MSKKKTEAVSRIDVQQLQKAVKLDNGFLKAPVFATRVGVFRYVRSDGTVLREYRPEAEVFSDASLETLKGVPFTNRHPKELVDSTNARKYTVGHVSDIVEREDKFVKTSVTVTDERTINEIENRGLREVSCGYRADLEFTPGITADGEEYDAIQRNIRYNHLSAVDRGRAGPQVRLILDSNEAIHEDGIELINPKSSAREDTMAKVTLNGAEFEVDAGVASAINSALEKAKKDGEKAAMEKSKAKKDQADEEWQKKIDAANAEIDTLKEDLEKTKKDSLSDEQIQAKVEARTKLLAAAQPLVKKDTDLSKMSDLEIKKAVIVEQTSLDAEDERLASEAYVDARFDGVVETAKPAPKKDALKDFLSNKEKNDGEDGGKHLDSEETRAKSMKEDSALWEQPIAGAKTKEAVLGGAQ